MILRLRNMLHYKDLLSLERGEEGSTWTRRCVECGRGEESYAVKPDRHGLAVGGDEG